MKIQKAIQFIPDRIRAIRTRRGLTQSQLAEMLSVSFVTVSRWETGYSKPSDLAWQQILRIEESVIGSAATDLLPSGSPGAKTTDFLADPERVQAFVEGERLEFGHLYNPAFATEISLIDPLPHQRIAVYERMLPQSRLRFLLADDAGAGKTIMTGMYIREMLSRRLIRRVLIVPPAGLLGNWYREMRTLFSLPFEIASGASIRAGNPFMGEGSDLRIVSVDTLAGERMFSNLQSSTVEPYDLVIFDEAHKLSANLEPDFYVRKTDRYRLAEAMAGIPMGDDRWDLSWSPTHLVLLTATPHMGKDYPYFAIWRLLEPEVLTTPDAFASYPDDARQRHFIRRVKEEMADMQGRPIYPTRDSSTHSFELTTGDISEQKLYDDMTVYLRHYYNMAPFLNRSAVRLAMSVFQRRLASSTWALLQSLERRLERVEGLLTDIREGKLEESRLRELSKEHARDIFFDQTADEERAADDGDGGEEENEIEETKAVGHIIATSLTGLETERDHVRRLVRLAQQVYDQGHESKFETLRELLQDPRFKNEKVLIFTEHRDTLAFLVRRLEGMGYTGQVAQIHGGMPYTEREEQVASFRKPKEEGGATYMVATDAAGEGINLQFCWLMVNYDIPWNPARLEQRMGRIHRYKQQHDPVIILNMIAGSTREGRVLKTLLDKLERIRKELRSDKVFDVVGRLFEGVSLRDYMESAITDEGAEAARLKIEGTLTKEQVLANDARLKRIYGEGGDIRREIDRLREQVNQEIYRRLLPGYVRQYFERAAPLVGVGIDGDMNPYFSLRLMEAGALDTLWPVLEAHPHDARRRLTVYRPSEACAIWVHPGESLFERFRSMASARLGVDGRQGAIFVDAATHRPYFFHVAQVSVVRQIDLRFRAFSKEEPVEVRLVAIKHFLNGQIEECPVEHLLLLKGNRQAAATFAGIAARASENIEAARSWLEVHIGQTVARERQQDLMRTLASRLDFLKRGYQFQEAELAAARARYTDKARTGDSRAQAELTRIRDRQRLLAQRKDQALREREREPELISGGEIELLAHALVVPSSDPEDRKKQDALVEQIAMQVAQAHEESQGARVWHVHTPELARRAGLPDYPGFDLLSERPNGEKRSIEVKGRARVGEIEVSGNEWAKACNLRDRYWLYVVFECASATPRLLRVPDPFGSLLAKNRGGVTIESTAVFNAADPG